MILFGFIVCQNFTNIFFWKQILEQHVLKYKNVFSQQKFVIFCKTKEKFKMRTLLAFSQIFAKPSCYT